MIRNLLIVEDNEALRRQISWSIPEDIRVFEAGDEKSALKVLLNERIDLLLLDLHLPPETKSAQVGKRLFYRAKSLTDPPLVIVITGDEDKKLALELIEEGVFDYLFKPVDADELKVMIKRALERKTLQDELRSLKREIILRGEGESLIGESSSMKKVFSQIEKVAPTDMEVLIVGESGTGKELVARAIHRLSKRKRGPFIPVDCGAIPENLAESELFGHEKGAFTGALSKKLGRFELASGGTLFLDEIANLSLDAQAKLLRFLEERVIFRIGGKTPIPVDTRVISATNRSLKEEMEKATFREDLFFRINAFVIEMPPLRERGEDTLILAKYFLERAQRVFKKKARLKKEARDLLLQYPWPGNVRELKHTIERTLLLCEGDEIGPEDLFPKVGREESENSFPLDLKEKVSRFEKTLVERALKEAQGDRKKAAEILSIDLHQLKYLLKKHNIS